MNKLPLVVNFQAGMMGCLEHHRTSRRSIDRRNHNGVTKVTQGRLTKGVGEEVT